MSDNRLFIKKTLRDLKSEYQNLISNRDINNDPTKLIEVYNDLENKSKNIKYDYTTAQAIRNKPRNRYFNVLPDEKTRFTSENLPYINANLIENKYILTQGPMRTYIKEFWIMVWESNAETIVCLANQIENSKKKFDPYYNDDKEQNYYDFNIQVQSVEKDTVHNVLLRKIQVTKTIYAFEPKNNNSLEVEIVEAGKEVRMINQIHYIGWPDNGMPSAAADILHILSLISKNTSQPIIVHCSAGIGRSGTLVVIKEILDQVESILNSGSDANFKIDIPGLIFKLRNYRQGLVQNVCQLAFCYSAVITGIKKLLEKSIILG